VRQLQMQLIRISRNYTAIPTLTADGVFGPPTTEAIRIFQRIFGLPETGIADYTTWYEVAEKYAAISRRPTS